MTVTINGTTGLDTPAITNNGAYTGDGISFADNAPSNSLVVNSSGNVGIGTSSPQRKLDVTVNDTSTNQLYLRNNNASYASGMIVYNAGGEASIFRHNGGSDTSYAGANSLNIGTVTNNNFAFITNNTERMRIDSSGNLLVGTTTNSPTTTNGAYIYGASGGASYYLNNSTTGGGVSLALFYSSFSVANQTKFEVTSEGNVKSRTNSYAGFSDERLKQNITPASSQWNDIKSYDIVKFQMKSEQFSDEENPWMLGVVAQQIEQTSPGLVEEDSKDGMKTVKYSIIYMKAVKALQEAMERIEKLEAEVAALKGAA